jgi:hypothetical protein
MIPENFVLVVKDAPIGVEVSWYVPYPESFRVRICERTFFESRNEGATRAIHERLRRLPPLPWLELEQALSLMIDPWQPEEKRQGRMVIAHVMDQIISATRAHEEHRRIEARRAEDQAEAERFYQGNSSWGRF